METPPSEQPHSISVAGQGVVGSIGDHNRVVIAMPPAPDVAWPVVVGRPPSVASSYQTRSAEDLIKASPSRNSVLVGEGGVGKTQVAAHIFAASRADVKAWVSADTRYSIISAYEGLARRLRLDEVDGSATVALFEFLASTPRPWLLILDDIQDPSGIRDLWPSGNNGRVVATTRRRDSELGQEARALLPVLPFNHEEGIGYLAARLTEEVERGALPAIALEDASLLLLDLGALPLALSQACSVIIDMAMTCSQYRQAFADREKTLAQLFPEQARADGYPATVATTWDLAIASADAQEPLLLARPLAELIATFNAESVPEAILLTESGRDFLSQRRAVATGTEIEKRIPVSAEQAREALRVLHRFSIVTHALEGVPSVRMHQLTARAIRESGGSFMDSVVAASSIFELWDSQKNDEELSAALRLATRKLAPNYSSVIVQMIGVHTVFFRCLRSLAEAGLWVDAADFALEIVQQIGGVLPPFHRDVLSLRSHHASAVGQAGDPGRAVELFADLVSIRRQWLGEDDADTLRARANHIFWRRHVEGEEAVVRDAELLQADRVRALGVQHRDTFTSAASRLSKPVPGLPEASRVEQLRSLVNDQVNSLVPDDRTIFRTRQILVEALMNNEWLVEAESELRRLIADQEHHFGARQFETLESRKRLVSVLARSEAPDRALPMQREVVAALLDTLGAQHPATLESQMSLANLIGQIEGSNAAVTSWMVAIEALEAVSPKSDDSFVARLADQGYDYFGQWLIEAERHEEALSCYQKLLRERLRHDSSGEQIRDAKFMIALELVRCKRFSEALEILDLLLVERPATDTNEEFAIRNLRAVALGHGNGVAQGLAAFDTLVHDMEEAGCDPTEVAEVRANQDALRQRAT